MPASVESRVGLVCPKHGKLLDTYVKREIHKGRKVKVIKEIKFKCGCEVTREA